MDLKGFLKENNGFPENKRVRISPCFRENGEEVLWELRAVSEEEYRRAAEGKRDKWAVLCMLSVVVPDLTDRALQESYGADSAEAALQEMLYPAIGGGEGYQWIPKPQKGLEGTGKKMIAEGVDEADYACYALRRYGIRPKDWAEMTTPERMFCCAVIEMEIAAEEKR